MAGAVFREPHQRAPFTECFCQSWRPLMRQWAIAFLTGGTAVAAVAADPSCDAAVTGLSALQRTKFSLATQACAGGLRAGDRTESSLKPADALIASDAHIGKNGRAIPQQLSRHLELFDTKSTASVLDETPSVSAGEAAPAATLPAPRVDATKPVSKPGAPLRKRTSASAHRALSLAPDVDAVARRHDIDPLLLHAIAHVESRHNAQALSPAGARGVMQVMPATARRFGVAAAKALQEPRTNLEVSAAYLKTLQKRFGNNLTLVLAAYNAGEGAVEKHGRRIPPYAETQGYVTQVLDHYRMLSALARRVSGSSPPSL